MLFHVNYIEQGHARDADLSAIMGHVAKWMDFISRFMRRYNAPDWGSYGFRHILGTLFAEKMLKAIRGKSRSVGPCAKDKICFMLSVIPCNGI